MQMMDVCVSMRGAVLQRNNAEKTTPIHVYSAIHSMGNIMLTIHVAERLK